MTRKMKNKTNTIQREHKTMNLEQLLTESRNPDTIDIDTLPTYDILAKINAEDKKVAFAVEKCLNEITIAVDWITEKFRAGGRLFYLGAGTSGRLGILDASECPPTYGTSPNLVQGLIAGGYRAVFCAVEGAEDSLTLAAEDLKEKQLSNKDIVVGIAASGRTPYVIGGLEYARKIGCRTVAIVCSPKSSLSQIAELTIAVLTGPEVIMGSTRMKAGTAQKMVLNMLTTAAMIKTGKVFSNLMVDVQATNRKLIERAKRIVCLATNCSREEAELYLSNAGGNAKIAIIMILTGLSAEDATKALAEHDNFISKVLR